MRGKEVARFRPRMRVSKVVARSALASDELQSSAQFRPHPCFPRESERLRRQRNRRPQWRNSDLGRTPTALTEPRHTARRILPHACPPAPTRSARRLMMTLNTLIEFGDAFDLTGGDFAGGAGN
jgi:hypothetical protein